MRVDALGVSYTDSMSCVRVQYSFLFSVATYSQLSLGLGRPGGQAEMAVGARSARTVAHEWRGSGSSFAWRARTGRRGRFGWGTSSGELGRGLPIGGG